MCTDSHRAPSPTDVRDSEARAIAASCLAGIMSEPDARWRIAGLLRGADVVEQVVAGLQVQTHLFEEVSDRMYDLVDTAITGAGIGSRRIGTRPKLDLERLASGTSLCGWARRYLSSQQARTTAQRTSWARERRETLVGELEERAAFDDLTSAFSGGGQVEEETVDAAISCLAEHAKGLRPLGRAHLAARTLRAVYNLPHLPRSVGRPALLAAVGADDRLAYAAVAFLADGVVENGVVEDECLLADLAELAELFGEWTDAQLRSLLDLSPLVAQALVVAALSPVPPPQAGEVRQLQARVAATGLSRQPARAVASALASIVTETTTSEYDALHELAAKTPEHQAADRARFEQVVAQLIDQGWTRFGSTSCEVEAHMRSMLDEIRYGELLAAA